MTPKIDNKNEMRLNMMEHKQMEYLFKPQNEKNDNLKV